MADAAERIRPYLFVRIRLAKGTTADFIRDLVDDERKAIHEDVLTAPNPKARRDFRQELSWAGAILSDLDPAGSIDALYLYIRLFRDGQALWFQNLLRDEQADLYRDLGDLRAQGRPEDDDAIADTREKLGWTVQVLRDVDWAMIDLVGPDRDPR